MLAGGLKTQNNGVYCKIRRASFDVFAMGEKTYPCFRQQHKNAIFSVDNKRMIITFISSIPTNPLESLISNKRRFFLSVKKEI